MAGPLVLPCNLSIIHLHVYINNNHTIINHVIFFHVGLDNNVRGNNFLSSQLLILSGWYPLGFGIQVSSIHLHLWFFVSLHNNSSAILLQGLTTRHTSSDLYFPGLLPESVCRFPSLSKAIKTLPFFFRSSLFCSLSLSIIPSSTLSSLSDSSAAIGLIYWNLFVDSNTPFIFWFPSIQPVFDLSEPYPWKGVFDSILEGASIRALFG